MIQAFHRDKIRQAEAAKVAQLPADTLMKKAAEAVAQVAIEMVSELPSTREKPLIVGLVGGGDNGGDALYALSFLANAGYPTRAVLLHRTPYRRAALAAKNAGVELVAVDLSASLSRQWAVVETAVASSNIWIDGLVGTGLQGALREPLAVIVKRLTQLCQEGNGQTKLARKIIAVDLPSGLAADDGTVSDVFLPASVTVTMGAVKSSALLPPACFAWGKIRVVDLGLELTDPVCSQLTAGQVGQDWVVPGSTDHKYTRGIPLVLAGSKTYPLTGVMCVEAAGRTGAGMVRYCGPQEASLAILSRFPEAVTTIGQHQSLLLGPGLDMSDQDRVCEVLPLLKTALVKQIPVVLDAGAFDLWPQIERSLLAVNRTGSSPGFLPQVVLTPHAGEAARLVNHYGSGHDRGGISRTEIEQSPVYWATSLAKMTGCTIVLKGAATVIAGGADTSVFVQREAPGWAGTAGSGDVLAGILAAVLANRQAQSEISGASLSDKQVALAAASAVWVHGTAARLAAGMSPVPESQPQWVAFSKRSAAGTSMESPKQLLKLGKPITATDIIAQIPSAISFALTSTSSLR